MESCGNENDANEKDGSEPMLKPGLIGDGTEGMVGMENGENDPIPPPGIAFIPRFIGGMFIGVTIFAIDNAFGGAIPGFQIRKGLIV